MSDRIGPVFVDQRQIGLHSGLAHALDEIVRDADLLAGRARDIDKVDQQVANTFGVMYAAMSAKSGSVMSAPGKAQS